MLPGQTSKRDSIIPPIPTRKSLDTPLTTSTDAGAGAGVAAAGATGAAAAAAATPVEKSGDLIDFGDDEASKPAAAASAETSAPEVAPAADQGANQISEMLSSTGKPAPAGPLMDFNKDLDKHLPTIKRSDTSGSQDIFHDAEN